MSLEVDKFVKGDLPGNHNETRTVIFTVVKESIRLQAVQA